MPARSLKQQRLFAAAKAGADFPKAKEIRASMTPAQIDEFTHKTGRAPHPAKNLGGHLRRPASGEVVTEKRWQRK